jgi:quercetin dioxygenase-like cupin family protein
MRFIHCIAAVISTMLVLMAYGISAQGSSSPAADIQWAPAPPHFPAGAQMALIQGSPTSDQPFTLRLRLPDGYRIAPHLHPTEEYVTVLQGTFLVGMGEEFDTRSMQAIPAGGFITLPREHAHYVQARGQTVVQVHAIGPFSLRYVNPADDPRGTAGR